MKLITERIDLFAPNIQVVQKVSIYGVPSIQALETAIRSACGLQESLKCKIVIDEDGESKYEKTKVVVPITIVNGDWEAIVIKQARIRMRIEEGELIRFFLIPKKCEIELVIIAHHLAGDGNSITYLIEDIMNILSGEKLSIKKLKIIEGQDFPIESRMPFLTKLYIRNLNNKWLRERKIYSFTDCKQVFKEYWSQIDHDFFSHEFTKEETEYICQYAKKADVTVNSLLTTVMIDTYNIKTDVGLAVSIRENYRGMANLVTGIAFKYKYRRRKSFIKNAQEVHKIIKKKLIRPKNKYFALLFLDLLDGPFIDSACVNRYVQKVGNPSNTLCKLMQYSENLRDIGISNLMKVDIRSNYGKMRIDHLVFLPPIVPYGRRICGVVTLEGKLNLTIHFVKDEMFQWEQLFFDKTILRLKDLE